MSPNDKDERPRMLLYCPDNEYVRPYFERHMSEYLISDDATEAEVAVMISSTDIYGVSEGLNYNELTPVDSSSIWVEREKDFMYLVNTNNIAAWAILRCAPIVATGMQGSLRKLVERIYRCNYFNIKGDESLCSVIHAVSLPDAARVTITMPGTYNVTDGDTLKSELADAFAWRIAQKRIFTIGPKLFKFLYGRKNYESSTASLTFSCEKLKSIGEFNPVKATDYLKNHNYNNESL